MATFKELLSDLKQLLKDNLKDDNLDMITKIDKGLDGLSESHEQTEKDLSSTKDKLVEVVKSYSFKDDSNATKPEEEDTDIPMDVDKALDLAINETISARKNN